MIAASPQDDMEDSDEQENTGILIGEKLRQARESRSLSIEEVASRLNLEEHVVRGLEQDDYSSLPEPAYIRGYLLAYLRLMELPVSLLKSFDDVQLVEQPLLMTNASVRSSSCSRDGWVRCVSTGLVVLLAIAIGMWVMEQSWNMLDIESATVESAQEQVVVTPVEEPVAEVELTDNEMSQLPVAVEEVASPDENKQDQVTNAATDVQQDVPLNDASQQKNMLIMTFTGASWIRIDNADGERLRSGTYDVGDKIKLSSEGALHLVIARTQYVQLSYGGEPVDLSGYKAGKVARLIIGKQVE